MAEIDNVEKQDPPSNNININSSNNINNNSDNINNNSDDADAITVEKQGLEDLPASSKENQYESAGTLRPPRYDPPPLPSGGTWRRKLMTEDQKDVCRRRATQCCKRSLRYLLFCMNSVLLLLGGAFLGLSIWIKGQTKEFFEKERHESGMVALLESTFECIFALGITFMSLALVGIVAQCARAPLGLLIYIFVMICFLITQIVPITTFVDHASYYGEKVRKMMTQTLHDKYIGANPTGEHKNAYTFVFDALNMVLQCCGVNNGTDFVILTDGQWKVNKLMEIGFEFTYPATCCKMDISDDYQKFTAKNKRCLFEPNKENTWLEVGCYSRISDALYSGKGVLLGIFSAFCIYEIFCIIIAGVEIWRLRKGRDKLIVDGRKEGKKDKWTDKEKSQQQKEEKKLIKEHRV